MAEFLLRQALSDKWGAAKADRWRVSSAGVASVPDRPMHPSAQTVLSERKIDSRQFRSRRLSDDLLEDADLVLTATRAHRSTAIRLTPAVLGRIFTIKQFGQLMSVAQPQPAGSPITAGHNLISQVARSRMIVPARTDEDDLADPVGRSMARFRACAKTLNTSIDQILQALPD